MKTKQKKKGHDSIKKLNEKFTFQDFKTIDARNRVNIGSKVMSVLMKALEKVDAFELFIGSEGDILLRPTAHIPSKELWLHENLEALKMVKKGLKDAKENRVTRVKDLDKYLDNL